MTNTEARRLAQEAYRRAGGRIPTDLPTVEDAAFALGKRPDESMRDFIERARNMLETLVRTTGHYTECALSVFASAELAHPRFPTEKVRVSDHTKGQKNMGLTDDEKKICARIGVSEEQYLAEKALSNAAPSGLSADEKEICAHLGITEEAYVESKTRIADGGARLL